MRRWHLAFLLMGRPDFRPDMKTATTATDRTAHDRPIYPAERAYGPRRETPAWRRIEPGLSGGYVEVHLACECPNPDFSFEEVTTT